MWLSLVVKFGWDWKASREKGKWGQLFSTPTSLTKESPRLQSEMSLRWGGNVKLIFKLFSPVTILPHSTYLSPTCQVIRQRLEFT